MIQNIEKGTGFKGAVSYALEKMGATRIGGTMLGSTPKQLAKEAAIVRSLNPRLGRAVFHASLSISSNDNLNIDQWNEITERYLKELGFENAPYVLARHNDTEHDHVHIIALRIDTKTGKTISDAKDFERGAKILQQIEADYGLTHEAMTPYQAKDVERKGLKKGEIEMAIRTGEKPPRLILQDAIDELLSEPISAVDLAESLSDAGIDVIANMSVNTGRMNGFTFGINGIYFKGGDLGARYKWSGLQKNGVTYEQARESESLARFAGSRPDQNGNRAGVDGADNGSINDSANGRNQSIIDGSAAVIEQSRIIDESPRIEDRDSLARTARERSAISIDDGRTQALGGYVAELDATRAAEAEPFAIGDYVGSERDALDNINSVASEVADMAAPVTPIITRDHQAKIDAWHKQAAALGAPFYRVGCVGRGDQDGINVNLGKSKTGDQEKFWSVADVEGLIPQLRRYNARGFDIYITPIDQNYHHILVDDVTDANIAKIKASGLEPALIQKSSDGNKQVIIRAERDSKRDSKTEQSLANLIVVDLNQRKGWGDPKITGARRPFRMAGFSNKKPNKNNFFTAIVESAGVVCKKTSKKLKKMRSFFDLEEARRKKNKEYRRRYDAIIEQQNIDKEPVNNVEMRYKWRMAYVLKYVENHNLPLDWSRVDYRVAKDLIKAGCDDEGIKKAMLAMSPALYDRKSNVSGYIDRTILAARNSDDVVNYLKSHERHYDNDSGHVLK